MSVLGPQSDLRLYGFSSWTRDTAEPRRVPLPNPASTPPTWPLRSAGRPRVGLAPSAGETHGTPKSVSPQWHWRGSLRIFPTSDYWAQIRSDQEVPISTLEILKGSQWEAQCGGQCPLEAHS